MRNRLIPHAKIKPVHATAALAAAGLLCACVGIALIYVPAALIVGGCGVAYVALFAMDVDG